MKKRGFTLIELLVTLSVIAIILSLAVPSFKSLMDRSAPDDIGNAIRTTLKLATKEAIRRGRSVEIVSLSGDWSNGWQLRESANAALIKEFQMNTNYVIQPVNVSNAGSMRVSSRGQVRNAHQIRIYNRGCEGANVIELTVLMSGDVRVGRTACPS